MKLRENNGKHKLTKDSYIIESLYNIDLEEDVESGVSETLWGAVCNNEIDKVKDYFEKGGEVNKRYNKFNRQHSLIMGALRNGNMEMVKLLKSFGETVLPDERVEFVDLMVKDEVKNNFDKYLDKYLKEGVNIKEDSDESCKTCNESSTGFKRAFKNERGEIDDYLDGKAIARVKDKDERDRLIATKRIEKKNKLGDRESVSDELKRYERQAEKSYDKKASKYAEKVKEECEDKIEESCDLKESNWSHTLSNGKALRDMIEDENLEGIRYELKKSYKELFDNNLIDEDDYDEWTEELEDIDLNEDEIDFQLGEFYDLCDNIRVWIPLKESLKEDKEQRAQFIRKPRYYGSIDNFKKESKIYQDSDGEKYVVSQSVEKDIKTFDDIDKVVEETGFKGGWTDDRKSISALAIKSSDGTYLVDPQGYDYARYLAFIPKEDVAEGCKKESDELNESKLEEGIWSFPNTKQKARKWNQILSKKWNTDEVETLRSELYNIFGCDDFFDDIDEYAEEGRNLNLCLNSWINYLREVMKLNGVSDEIISIIKDAKEPIKEEYEEQIVNGYVVAKSEDKYWVYNNEGHFEEDKFKAQGYPTLEMAIERAKSLPKGIAVELDESLKEMKEPIDTFKTYEFAKKTNQGWEVVKAFKDKIDNRMHIIAYRPKRNDYAVGLGYNADTGSWNQGWYDYTNVEDAEKSLKKKYDVEEISLEESCKKDIKESNISEVEEDKYVYRAPIMTADDTPADVVESLKESREAKREKCVKALTEAVKKEKASKK